MIVRSVLFAMLILMSTACVSSYQQVRQEDDHAVFELERGLEKTMDWGESFQQQFFVTNEDCKEMKRLALFQGFITPKKMARRVAADERLYVAAIKASATAAVTTTCINLASFSPVKGRKYKFLQSNVEGDRFRSFCQLTVVDEATQLPPPDLEFHRSNICEKPLYWNDIG